jgi:hypothetical protein
MQTLIETNKAALMMPCNVRSIAGAAYFKAVFNVGWDRNLTTRSFITLEKKRLNLV